VKDTDTYTSITHHAEENGFKRPRTVGMPRRDEGESVEDERDGSMPMLPEKTGGSAEVEVRRKAGYGPAPVSDEMTAGAPRHPDDGSVRADHYAFPRSEFTLYVPRPFSLSPPPALAPALHALHSPRTLTPCHSRHFRAAPVPTCTVAM
jgi:hypothetical protein